MWGQGVRLLCFILAGSLFLARSAPADAVPGNYEESLKQLAEGVIAEAVKLKKERLAILDFVDSKGTAGALGRFLAEELRTQILVSGELKVVDRTLVESTLKKLRVTRLDGGQGKAVRRAAKAVRADLFVTGAYAEAPDGLHVTLKLIAPSTVQTIGAARGTISRSGPLADLLKEPEQPATVDVDGPKEPAPSPGLGHYANEWYQLTVTAVHRTGGQVKVDIGLENLSPRDVKILCQLQGTVLEDEQGVQWKQEVESNREGLCLRGLELSPREKDRTVLTFSAAAAEASGSRFLLRFHERAPRRDAEFTIGGLVAEPRPSAALPVSGPDSPPSP